jgi:hypothetical protein
MVPFALVDFDDSSFSLKFLMNEKILSKTNGKG